MNYQSKITNFGEYAKDQLAELRNELSLNVSLQTLSFCSQYYKNQNRDPFVDELKTLDALSITLEQDLDSITPTELLTNDEFAAETYADLLQKRKALHPNATYPCTLREAARLASAYLFRAGKSKPSRCAAMVPEHLSHSRYLVGDSVFTAHNSPFRLRILPYSTAEASVGDVFLLTSPEKGQTQLQFEKAMESLLQSDKLRPYLKGVYTVPKGGILPLLLECVNGLRISLSSFSKLGIPMPMTVLTNQFASSKVLRVTPGRLSALLRSLSAEGILTFAFAEVTNDANYTFYRGNDEPFSLHTQFLRMLFHYRSVSAKLADEFSVSPSKINHRVVTEANCKYLSLNVPNSETVKIHDVLSAAASATAKQAHYKTALYTVLCPILSLCATGTNYSDQLLSIGIDFPSVTTDPLTVGAMLSSILGIYRAQTELGIPAQAISIHNEGNISSPTVTAFATAAGDPISGELTQKNSKVYCLSPRMYENGLPDFNSLREMMDTLVSLAKKKAILSYSPLCFESITDGIRSMSKQYTCRITDPTVASEGKLPIGILIESCDTLPYRCVGITVEKKTSAAESPVTVPQKESLIWSPSPQVVIVAAATDTDAQILAKALEKNGCCIHAFSSNTTNDAALSRAILGAQTLILCGSATIPVSERMSFALSTFRQAGGLCLSVGAGNHHTDGFFSLKTGIDKSLLEKICRK